MNNMVDNADKLYGTDKVSEASEPEEKSAPRVRPNGDLVLLKRLKKDERTKGGIILPEGADQFFFRAEVMAIGMGQQLECGEWTKAFQGDVGDIVLVQDEQEQRGPQGQRTGRTQKHLIPVTPDDRRYVLCPGSMIYAIELRPVSHPKAEPGHKVYGREQY